MTFVATSDSDIIKVRYNNVLYSLDDFNNGCIFSDLVNIIFNENTL